MKILSKKLSRADIIEIITILACGGFSITLLLPFIGYIFAIILTFSLIAFVWYKYFKNQAL
jgi:hypothetical protein